MKTNAKWNGDEEKEPSQRRVEPKMRIARVHEPSCVCAFGAEPFSYPLTTRFLMRLVPGEFWADDKDDCQPLGNQATDRSWVPRTSRPHPPRKPNSFPRFRSQLLTAVQVWLLTSTLHSTLAPR